MYTRNFGKQKYTPPPGYVGTAFGTAVETKHHEPMEMIRTEEKVPIIPDEALRYRDDEQPTEAESCTELQPAEIQREENALHQLLDSLRGKFGTEELIILLVMLLIASDGFGAEMLILGILLAAGN